MMRREVELYHVKVREYVIYDRKLREEVKAGEALHVWAERLSKLPRRGAFFHASVDFEFRFFPSVG